MGFNIVFNTPDSFVNVLETRIIPLACALTLNPSFNNKEEGLQSSSPYPFLGEEVGEYSLLPAGWAAISEMSELSFY
ncbi:MAG: hypothetical protein NZ772_19225 [Cyanobacteria bacterium]|nr:hypothetical protein [Cyanobacteriota bacterium]